MYQCYVVQEFNGVPYNVVLGRNYETKAEAEEIVKIWARDFGKIQNYVIEPAGTPIPTEKPKKETFMEKLLSWFK